MRNHFLLWAAILIASLCSFLPTHTAFANEESDKHNLQGLEYFNAGNYQAAVTEFSEAIKIEPNNSTYHNNIGWSYYSWGVPYYTSAEENFKESIRLDVKHESAYRGLAHLYHTQCKNDDAINNFIEAGKKYYNKENYTEAIIDFTDAINLGGGTAEIYNLRGLSHYNLENPDYDAALTDFNKAIELDNNFTESFVGRASVYTTQDKKDEAITTFMQAGGKYLISGENVKANEVYKFVIELNPEYGHAYFGLGQVELRQNKWQEAINHYNKAIELNYAEDYVYSNRGYAKYKLGHYDDAIADFNKALEIDVTHADAYQWRGDAYLCLTKLDH